MMWQRFTERARRVVFFAQEEAGRYGQNCVATGHLLLGLVREQSFACRVLQHMGISPDLIRSEVKRDLASGEGRLGQDMQLTLRSKRIIDLAYDEARQMKNTFIGTEHLLLGMIRENEGLAGRVLAKLGVELERTREMVRSLQDKDPNEQESQSSTSSMGDRLNEDRLNELFALALNDLPAEQLTALFGDGLPLNQLEEVVRNLLTVIFQRSSQGGVFVLDPNAVVRANIAKSDGNTHFTVTTPVTFLANLLVKES